MKKVIFLIVSLLFTLALWAQTPQSFRYQAVARDNSGNILANQPVSFKISILSGNVLGTISYSETHTSLTTNAFGLIELEIGKGAPVTGTFSAINWGGDVYFVKVEMDPAGGSDYQPLSTSQLLSVPYALHAKTVETGDNWGNQAVVPDATLGGNGTTATPLKIADGGVTSAKITDETIVTADLADMAITSSKIQDGSITNLDLAGDIITTWKILDGTIAANDIGSNAVTDDKIAESAVTGNKIARNGATTGQALKWNGSLWAPANDETGEEFTLPYTNSVSSANNLFSITNTGTGYGLYGKSPSVGVFGTTGNTSGRGVLGLSHTSGYTIGIDGQTASPDGTAVNGIASSVTGTNYAVKGSTNSASGFSGHFTGGKFYVSGDMGIGTQNPGAKLEVAGQVKITGGAPGAAKVLTSDATGLASWQIPAVDGLTLPYEGTAVTSEIASSSFKVSNSGSNQVVAITGHATTTTNSATGIYARSDAYDGKGIYAIATHKTGITYGVLGTAESTMAWGVWGSATAATGTTYGVYGTSASTSGTAIYGNASAGSGTTYGVYGSSSSSSGVGVYGNSKNTGVYGIATSTTGKVFGVYAKSSSPDGLGIYGGNSSLTGAAWGVYGESLSSGGIGVEGVGYVGIYGLSEKIDGKAIYGFQKNSEGYSGYFYGGKVYVYGNVGIGDSSPGYRLSVYAPGTTSTGIAGFYNSNGDPKVIIRQNSNGGGALNIYNNAGTTTISITGEDNCFFNSGNLGIGTTAPAYKLQVGTSGDGTQARANAWNAFSDERLKRDFTGLKNPLSMLEKLSGYYFFWNSGIDQTRQIGFSAQEVRNVLPEVVSEDKDGYLSLDYGKMTPLLLEAIKTQQGEIRDLKSQNDQLKERLEKLEKLVGVSVQN